MHLADDHGLPGTIVHNPRSNMNNGVGYARPTRFANPVALGSDGIGASMLDEFRLAFARLREHDVTAGADQAWRWLAEGWTLFPEALGDRVRWSYEPMEPWALAYTTDVRPLEVQRRRRGGLARWCSHPRRRRRDPGQGDRSSRETGEGVVSDR